ncbi:MAG: ammonium transporter [Actinomycetes bacterium]
MEINAGDTSWVLLCTALVFVMAPGLALFYGGLVRAKSSLNMMMMTFIAVGIVGVLWTLFGFSISFGDSGNGFFGGFDSVGLGELLNQLAVNGGKYPIPALAFAMFQLMFAIITVALISGSIADRAKFSSWAVFVAAWVTLVYFPVAHWVFDFGGDQLGGPGAGWLANRGILDFAGGTVVEINSGASGLALALIVGRRVGWPKSPMKPHNLPLVLLGAGLLWFGWLGFNAGSSLGANQLAATALANTVLAGCGGLLSWLFVERIRDGHATSLGAASGVVAGLVAITPACGFIAPWAAVVLGLIAGAACAFTVGLKYRLGFDDSLDVFGVHLVGGVIGCLALGFVATTIANPAGKNGLLYGGGWSVLGTQSLGVVAVLAYSFTVTLVIGWVINKVMGFRVDEEAEVTGIDLDQHLETAYDFSAASGGALGQRTARATHTEVGS